MNSNLTIKKVEDATLVYVNERLFADIRPYGTRKNQFVIDGNLNTGEYRSARAAMVEVKRRLALGLGR